MILYYLITKKIKDALVLSWLKKIIFSTDGVPIGSYTSQYFANIFLAYFDHFCKEVLHIKYYFRYADDIVILASDKEILHEWFGKINFYLAKRLNLTIKNNYQIFPVDSRGIDFVGYVFYHDKTFLRKSIKVKMFKLINKYLSGKITIDELRASFASYNGWLKYCDSKNLLKKIERLCGIKMSNWRGKQTTFAFVKNKSVRLIDVEKRSSYYNIDFILRGCAYYIKSRNKYYCEYLSLFRNKNIYL